MLGKEDLRREGDGVLLCSGYEALSPTVRCPTALNGLRGISGLARLGQDDACPMGGTQRAFSPQ